MSSLLLKHSSNLLLCCLFLYSCTQKTATSRTWPKLDAVEYPVLYPAFVAGMDEAPLDFPAPWNVETLKKMGVRSIVLYNKGGRNPEDTLEEITLTFTNNWSFLHYKGYKFDETRTPRTTGRIQLPGKQTDGEIYFRKHLGIVKEHKTIVRPTENGFLCLQKRANARFDTTWIQGTLQQPEFVASKIGNTLYSIDLYIKYGSSTSQIGEAFSQLPFSPESISRAQCSVIFTRNGRPIDAFLLYENFVQIIRTKAWTYNSDHTLASYQEWLGNSVIKTMSWQYGESTLPTHLIVNRKTYFYHYQ